MVVFRVRAIAVLVLLLCAGHEQRRDGLVNVSWNFQSDEGELQDAAQSLVHLGGGKSLVGSTWLIQLQLQKRLNLRSSLHCK